jgi:drug/metabolite transporter (DMT)-like permease
VAIVAGIYAYDQQLDWSQWLGVGLILGSVTLLPMQRRRVVVEPPHERHGELVPATASA